MTVIDEICKKEKDVFCQKCGEWTFQKLHKTRIRWYYKCQCGGEREVLDWHRGVQSKPLYWKNGYRKDMPIRMGLMRKPSEVKA